jgi:hypothetical protein
MTANTRHARRRREIHTGPVDPEVAGDPSMLQRFEAFRRRFEGGLVRRLSVAALRSQGPRPPHPTPGPRLPLSGETICLRSSRAGVGEALTHVPWPRSNSEPVGRPSGEGTQPDGTSGRFGHITGPDRGTDDIVTNPGPRPQARGRSGGAGRFGLAGQADRGAPIDAVRADLIVDDPVGGFGPS